MTTSGSETRTIRAARGNRLTAKSWQTEGPLRMLMNNLDPEVAERPDDLVVYGGTGRAARSWEAYDAIVRTLETLESDETLLVQSGKPVGVFRTHEWAPRVLIANSNLVGDWATWPEFRRLEALGLMMYGQMTAGSWIYIGTQGILQGTYETFAAVATKRFGGTLAGTLTLTGGAGGMGGAQPLAVTMNDGRRLIVDVDPGRLRRRVEHRYLDEMTDDLDDAIESRAPPPRPSGARCRSASSATPPTIFPEMLARGVAVDIVTDQTSAHDPLRTTCPSRSPSRTGSAPPPTTPTSTPACRMRFDGRPCEGDGRVPGRRRRGVRLRQQPSAVRPSSAASTARSPSRASSPPTSVLSSAEGLGPFRWAALSGDPADIAATDKAILELFPNDEKLRRWITAAGEKVHFEGLPARICWLGYKERHLAGLKFNEMVASGELSAPVAIGRDHLDSGSVASPYRETEAMADGSDAIADWPLLNALLNTASGATWVSLHHGGGVGIGRSIHAGQVVVADGTPLAAEKIERVLTNDPGTGVMRHVDAGYERAAEVARERGLRVPMWEQG